MAEEKAQEASARCPAAEPRWQQVFDTMSEAMGVDFREILKAQTYDAKVTRNINVTGIDKKENGEG